MHACNIKFASFNVRSSCLIRENHEHLYPRNIPAIRYIIMFGCGIELNLELCQAALLNCSHSIRSIYHAPPNADTLPELPEDQNPGESRQGGGRASPSFQGHHPPRRPCRLLQTRGRSGESTLAIVKWRLHVFQCITLMYVHVALNNPSFNPLREPCAYCTVPGTIEDLFLRKVSYIIMYTCAIINVWYMHIILISMHVHVM